MPGISACDRDVEAPESGCGRILWIGSDARIHSGSAGHGAVFTASLAAIEPCVWDDGLNGAINQHVDIDPSCQSSQKLRQHASAG